MTGNVTSNSTKEAKSKKTLFLANTFFSPTSSVTFFSTYLITYPCIKIHISFYLEYFKMCNYPNAVGNPQYITVTYVSLFSFLPTGTTSLPKFLGSLYNFFCKLNIRSVFFNFLICVLTDFVSSYILKSLNFIYNIFKFVMCLLIFTIF